MQQTAAPLLKIGTRGSPLALAQAHETRDRLVAAHGMAPDAIEIVIIKTTGDQIADRPLGEVGGKGLFTKEIEEALLDGRIDLAVHSMKDMPTALPDALTMAALLPREDVRDGLICPRHGSIADLPAGATVGTASLRRQAQLLSRRPDLKIALLRGNVQTRLGKIADGVVDATFLAMAGLRRLGLADKARAAIEPEEMLPAVAQGAIGIETREADSRTRDLLAAIGCTDTWERVGMERAFLAALDGSCRTPIAGLAIRTDDGGLWFRGEIVRPDGSERHVTERRGAAADAEALGRDAGEELKAKAGPGFFAH